MDKETILRNRHFVVLLVILALGIYLQIIFLFTEDVARATVLLIYATLSTVGTFWIWSKFIAKYSQKVFWFVCRNFIGKKLIAGGTDVYFEQKRLELPVGFFTPVGRLISILIAFLALATTIIKALRSFNFITFDTPTESWTSVITWVLLLTVVPLILTPIIPVTWAMEDLGLKVWNGKKDIAWMVADRYRARFNSFIAIGALTAGLVLTEERAPSFIDNITLFGSILIQGVILLVYPLTLLTGIYFARFRGKITEDIRENLVLPIARTEKIEDYEEYLVFRELMDNPYADEKEIVQKLARLRREKQPKEKGEIVEKKEEEEETKEKVPDQKKENETEERYIKEEKTPKAEKNADVEFLENTTGTLETNNEKTAGNAMPTQDEATSTDEEKVEMGTNEQAAIKNSSEDKTESD
ncbi:MAG: hypothetical protein D6732_02005 [Methanobacteriota archaeon]|nr:MAG: hypothetical protein D6732_02005 [Euryarchaeota archaeon]